VPTERVVGRLTTVVTLVCVVTVGFTVLMLASPSIRTRLGLSTRRAVSYPLRSSIDVPAHLYQSAPLTLFVFGRSTCGACQAAKPAFLAISRELAATPTNMQFVTGQTDLDAELEYANEIGLATTQVVRMDLSALRLQVVPALVLVDRSGKVLFTKEGVPTADDQQQLFRQIRIRVVTDR